MALLITAGSIARFCSPIWGMLFPPTLYIKQKLMIIMFSLLGDATYLAADHRTWLPMSVLSTCQLIVIVFFLTLYRTYKIKRVWYQCCHGDYQIIFDIFRMWKSVQLNYLRKKERGKRDGY